MFGVAGDALNVVWNVIVIENDTIVFQCISSKGFE